MSDIVCYLITLVKDDQIFRCALKIKIELLPGDCFEYRMEPENRKKLLQFLPEYFHDHTVVEITEIFDVVVVGE